MRLKIGDAPSLGNLFEIADLRRWTVTALGEVGAGLAGLGPQVQHLVSPLPGTAGFPAVPRSLSAAFLDESRCNREDARRNRDRLRSQIVLMTKAGRQARVSAVGGPDHRRFALHYALSDRRGPSHDQPHYP